MKKPNLPQIAVTVAIVLSLCVGLGIWVALRGPLYFKHAAVVANGDECAQIGRDILKQNGTVADAAIATLFCEGVASPQSTSIAGGFLLTIYKKDTGTVQTLNARETTPAAMKSHTLIEDTDGLVVGVPGELRGYRELYKRYGRLPWRQLVEPAIKLCREGHVVTYYLTIKMNDVKDFILKDESFRELFVNPATGRLKGVGDRIKRPKLADTLEIIAEEGPDALHNGTLTKQFVEDIKKFGGLVTEEDMLNYEAKWEKPVKISLPDNLTLYSTPLPGGGVLLAYIMNILNGFVPDSSVNIITEYHRMVETFKLAFAMFSHLGDRNFVVDIDPLIENLTSVWYAKESRRLIWDNRTSSDPTYYGADRKLFMKEHQGTLHVSILAQNGDAIAVTSTINYNFGARSISRSTGIFLNNEMMDFCSNSPTNDIEPGKQPMSSMCPTIIIDKDGNAKLIIGGDGGYRILTVVSFVITRYLFYKEPLTEAINAKRVHHHLVSNEIHYDRGFDGYIVAGFRKIGHNTAEQHIVGNARAIAKENDKIFAVTDPKRPGSIAGY